MTRAFMVTAFLLAVSAPAGAQTTRDELTTALIRLQRAVDALEPPLPRPRGLVEAVEWLRVHTGTTDLSQVSPAYLRTLTNAAALLSGSPSANLVDDITEELQAKVDHCRSLGIGMGGSVLLHVNTRRGDATVNNWQVLYLLKIYEEASGAAPTTFATLSAPADTRLEPGRYWIWARDPATGRMSRRELVRISGKREFEIDLPVP